MAENKNPKYVYMSTGRPGYQIIYTVIIKNSHYLNLECESIEIFKDEKYNVTCQLKSYKSGTRIRDSKTLSFLVGDFSSAEDAKIYAKNLLFSIKYFLSQSGCSCSIEYRIKDLAALEILSSCIACLSLLTPFKMDTMLPLPNDKAKNAINLLEKSEALPYTELRFFMYVVILESLLDDDATRAEKEPGFLSALDSTMAFVEQSNNMESTHKQSINDYLSNFRYIGSRKAVTAFIQKYFPDQTTLCDGKQKKYTAIYQKCYTMRNHFVHNGVVDKEIPMYADAIRKIAYDMVYAYANDPDNVK